MFLKPDNVASAITINTICVGGFGSKICSIIEPIVNLKSISEIIPINFNVVILFYILSVVLTISYGDITITLPDSLASPLRCSTT